MVVAARNMADIGFSHRIANLIHTGITNLIYGSKIRDINSGLRAMKIEKYRGQLTARRMDMVAQITCLALRNKFKIKDIPIKYGKRRGHSKIGIIDGFDILWRIFRERVKGKIKI
jgi:hypothetical protein